MIINIIMLILAGISFVISYFQHKQKGFLFNNAYIYASKKERDKMNKAPYYKQSRNVFFMIGILYLSIPLIGIIEMSNIIIVLIALLIAIYAVISSIKISKEENAKDKTN